VAQLAAKDPEVLDAAGIARTQSPVEFFGSHIRQLMSSA
jgi:hypothetical protein